MFTLLSSPARAQSIAGKKGRRLLLGLVFSSIIALLARRRRSLSKSGTAGTVVVGTTIFGMGGWSWGLSLIYFFVSSTLFSHFREREKALTAADKFSKGSERDIGQVAANGGLATLLALVYGLVQSRSWRQSLPLAGRPQRRSLQSLHTSPSWRRLLPLAGASPATTFQGLAQVRTRQRLLTAGFTGALATATADTWATESGVLSPHPPRLITTGKRVAPGTSGGVTLLGTAASAIGALSLGAVFWGLQGFPKSLASLPLVALISGLAGSFFDSLLGATVQAMYYCPTCNKETERRIHSCGTRTKPLRGIPWMNNDVVNFLATFFGGGVAVGIERIFHYA